jgi:hypothetical protein
MGIDCVDQGASSLEVFGAANFGLISAFHFTSRLDCFYHRRNRKNNARLNCVPEGSTAGAKRTWRNPSKTS